MNNYFDTKICLLLTKIGEFSLTGWFNDKWALKDSCGFGFESYPELELVTRPESLHGAMAHSSCLVCRLGPKDLSPSMFRVIKKKGEFKIV